MTFQLPTHTRTAHPTKDSKQESTFLTKMVERVQQRWTFTVSHKKGIKNGRQHTIRFHVDNLMQFREALEESGSN